jgi:hypothetical protein
MTPATGLSSDASAGLPAVERAIAFGVDITLLIENLRLTPTERVRRAQQMLDSVVALQAEVKAWRERQAQSP